ncbi:MAG: ribosomal protein S18-alanine N-acetyltransferase [Candidatus Bathyarchaeota archaeon]|nr:MAG: ribosomal protein S18-alanine N-acetyltransferase [Candidatus Bathyarchaeota archaeon]
MKDLKLRFFTFGDLDLILKIEKSSFGEDAFSPETFLSLSRRFPDLFIIAEKNAKIVGYMITCNLRHKGHVISIAVDPSCRHMGVGSALATFTFESLKTSGIENIELEVRKTNYEGVRFWEHLGFRLSEVVQRFYEDGEDALRMKKVLNE